MCLCVWTAHRNYNDMSSLMLELLSSSHYKRLTVLSESWQSLAKFNNLSLLSSILSVLPSSSPIPLPSLPLPSPPRPPLPRSTVLTGWPTARSTEQAAVYRSLKHRASFKYDRDWNSEQVTPTLSSSHLMIANLVRKKRRRQESHVLNVNQHVTMMTR